MTRQSPSAVNRYGSRYLGFSGFRIRSWQAVRITGNTTRERTMRDTPDTMIVTTMADRKPPTPTVSDILREYVPQFLEVESQRGVVVAPHVTNTLARLALCRTEPLGQHEYRCDDCGETAIVYNSCGERSCPRCCGGNRRDDWWLRMEPLVLPRQHFYQVVFTLPDHDLSWLLRANRERLFSLIMQAAWKAIRKFIRKLGVQPSATIVLHTWNQRLGFHVHVHVLIPAGGISRDGRRWIDLTESDLELTQPDRRAGHVGNQLELGRSFRNLMINGIVRLYRRGQLKLPGMKCLLFGDRVLRAWLDRVAPNGYGVFVEPPPAVEARPENILNYIGRYVTGGPISDGRIVSNENGMVKFMARRLDSTPGEKPDQVPIEVSGVEFVRRWIQHILPKGFVRSRHYGNHANSNRAEYLKRARELLGVENDEDETLGVEQESNEWNPDAQNEEEPNEVEVDYSIPRCPKCGRGMRKVEWERRPSWRIIMNGPHRPTWYDT